ncbi:MAG TPA: aldo/keto reductase [Devosiaceae bacterium]|nr:aldo/keto reductase [Devosiaceae bacterium]
MDPFATRQLGRTTLALPRLGFGGAGLGNIIEDIPEAQALATVDAAWDAGVRYYDTSPWYGRGLSERRIGNSLLHKPAGERIISTKVGRLFTAPEDPAAFARSERAWPEGLHFAHRHDYTYGAIMRSYEDSLQRLGVNRVNALIVHDLDLVNLGSQELVDRHFDELTRGGGFRALEELKAAGLIQAIGAGVNRLGTIPAFLDRVDVDFFLVAIPYTLVEQPALDQEFPLCAARGVGLVIGAVFATGILATGPVPGARYNYHVATHEELGRVARMEAVCARHGVPLASAAMQFPLHHPLVASVIPGAIHPSQVVENVRHMRHDIPDDLWHELKAEGLLRADAPTP